MRGRPSITRNCDYCYKPYAAHLTELSRGWGLCCSKTCATKNRRTNWLTCHLTFKNCAICETLFTSHHGMTLCGSDSCQRKSNSAAASKSIMKRYRIDPEFRDKMIAASQARRAEKLGLGSQQVSLNYLGERDSWTCQLCHLPIQDRTQASIDHIIPLSRGGAHDLANVHLAHRSCNASKNNRAMNEQLIAFG